MGQSKEAAKFAFEHRRKIKEGDFSVFLFAFAVAILKDSAIDTVPIVGWVIGPFITVYLFIFLFGKGKWKVRFVIFILSAFELIPVVDLLPFQTICVLYVYYQAKKAAEEEQRKIEEENKHEVRILYGAEARAAKKRSEERLNNMKILTKEGGSMTYREHQEREAARQARTRQTANDSRYQKAA